MRDESKYPSLDELPIVVLTILFLIAFYVPPLVLLIILGIIIGKAGGAIAGLTLYIVLLGALHYLIKRNKYNGPMYWFFCRTEPYQRQINIVFYAIVSVTIMLTLCFLAFSLWGYEPRPPKNPG